MNEKYNSPLSSRYASEYMLHLFSQEKRVQIWRRLWVALARAEHKLGLPVTVQQVTELENHIEDIDFACAAAREKEVRHDVMAHVYAYGKVAPSAAGIIHLGATSCYVTDNADLILYREGLRYLRQELLGVMANLAAFAKEYRAMPTLGYTHYQPAQLVTVGKRATLWLQDVLLDYYEVEHRLETMRLLGSKGTTGTQASFMELFEGDEEKIRQLDQKIADKMGFAACYPVSGQTYSRKLDYQVVSVLSGIAQSASKFANDLRLLQHMKEIEEPFEKTQIGSSAMAYKRNPMRSERICSLARYVTSDALNPALTASTQWLERTLDDSANKRISVAEAFLATDAILELYINVVSGLVVYPKMIEKHLLEELPFMATENIMMEAVKKGGDRQDLHEHIRVHSMDAGKVVKVDGGQNDLLQRIANDPAFGMTLEELEAVMEPKNFVGRAPSQTQEFVDGYIKPVLEEKKDLLGIDVEINV